MKRFLTLTLSIVLIFTLLVGCGQKQDETGGTIILATTTSTPG